MKKDIHPQYDTCQVRCACGNSFETKSVEKEVVLEICSECHPFYTGNQKSVERGGRAEKFKQKYGM